MEGAAECRLRSEILEQRLEALMNVVPLIPNKRHVERVTNDTPAGAGSNPQPIARRRRHRQTRNSAKPKQAQYQRSQPALTPEAFLIHVKLPGSL
jgi:hypothetical protein